MYISCHTSVFRQLLLVVLLLRRCISFSPTTSLLTGFDAVVNDFNLVRQ